MSRPLLKLSQRRCPLEPVGSGCCIREGEPCTNIIENMMGGIRRVCRNVRRWRDAPMALRWTGAAMLQAAKEFRRLQAHKQLPVLRTALVDLQKRHASNKNLAPHAVAA